jgi:S1-C subfamily serine protease
MQTLKTMLLAVVVSASTLVLAAGCDAVRSSVSTAAPTATVTQNQPPPTAPATAQAPTAPPQPTAAAKAPVAQAPPPPVLQAAPAQQPTDTVVRVYRDVRPSVVTVISSVVQPGFRSEPQPQGTGSGFMIDDRGHILTNNHVVQDADKLEVALSSGTTIPAELVGRDSRFDLAVIRA